MGEDILTFTKMQTVGPPRPPFQQPGQRPMGPPGSNLGPPGPNMGPARPPMNGFNGHQPQPPTNNNVKLPPGPPMPGGFGPPSGPPGGPPSGPPGGPPRGPLTGP